MEARQREVEEQYEECQTAVNVEAMSSEQARIKSKARRSDEAGFGAIGGRFHATVTATLTMLMKAMEVIKKRGGKGERQEGQGTAF